MVRRTWVVIKFTKEYRKAQDSILQFIDLFIKHKEPDNKLLTLKSIYNEFNIGILKNLIINQNLRELNLEII